MYDSKDSSGTLYDLKDCDDRVEYGSNRMHEVLAPCISHQTLEFDVPRYIAGFQLVREELLSDPNLRFTEEEIEASLEVAVQSVEDYVILLRETAVEEQSNA